MECSFDYAIAAIKIFCLLVSSSVIITEYSALTTVSYLLTKNYKQISSNLHIIIIIYFFNITASIRFYIKSVMFIEARERKRGSM